MSSTGESRDGEAWHRHARTVFVTLAAAVGLLIVLIAVANPYGNLPGTLFSSHAIMDTNQRYQYPAIVRSGRFDSIVIGTSTSRLLKPAALERVFGGHFANLAMDSGTAWEQSQMAALFSRELATPATLVAGADHVWCRADAGERRITERGFPVWMFDDNPWNDLPWMLNKRSAEIALRRIAFGLGLMPERIPMDGYEVFVPPDDQFGKIKTKFKFKDAAQAMAPLDRARPAVAAGAPGAAKGYDFPALTWLEDLASQRWKRIVFVIPPPHISDIAPPETASGQREAACKAEMAAIARRHGIPLIDFRFASPITSRRENYWDALHYRVPVAERIVNGIGRALATGADDPDGEFRVLSTTPGAARPR